METQLKNISPKSILIAIGVGIWVLVLQNAGIVPKLIGTENGLQTVYVKGGNIDADVSGSVNIKGGNIDADVSGTVSVDNTVDINIKSVNGHTNAFYGPSKDGSFDALHVYTGK